MRSDIYTYNSYIYEHMHTVHTYLHTQLHKERERERGVCMREISYNDLLERHMRQRVCTIVLKLLPN